MISPTSAPAHQETSNSLPLKAVLWDMDGTLVDTEPYWIAAERSLVQAHGGQWSQEQAFALVGNALDDSARVLQGAGVDLSVRDIIDHLSNTVIAGIRKEVPWRPGARELLADLRRNNVRCALVTMSERQLAAEVVAALDEEYFEFLVTGDEVTHGKPHPEPYLVAVEKLQLTDPELTLFHCAALEDSIPGVASALASGMATIAVPNAVPLGADARRTTWDTLEGKTHDDVQTVLVVHAASVGAALVSGSTKGTKTRREGLVLGSVRGTPIILANSWFFIAAVTVMIFGPQLQSNFPGLGGRAYLVAFAYALLLLLSVFIHELAHALAAKMYGWQTHKIVLNLWGGHTEFDFSKATPGKALVVAFAGPIANFVLAGLGLLVKLILPDPTTLLSVILLLLANIFIWANLLIGVFNILPGLPLDGGRLVESIVWKSTGSQEKGTVAAGWAGRIIVVVIVAVVLVVPYLQGKQPDLTTTFIVVLLAGFLWMGASASIKGASMRLRLPAISAGTLAAPAVSASIECTVAQLWTLRGQFPQEPIVLFGQDGRPTAVVDEFALAHVPPQAALITPASAVARMLSKGAYVPDEAAGVELVSYLAQLPDTEYAVINLDGKVTGLLSQAKVVAAMTGKGQQ